MGRVRWGLGKVRWGLGRVRWGLRRVSGVSEGLVGSGKA